MDDWRVGWGSGDETRGVLYMTGRGRRSAETWRAIVELAFYHYANRRAEIPARRVGHRAWKNAR